VPSRLAHRSRGQKLASGPRDSDSRPRAVAAPLEARERHQENGFAYGNLAVCRHRGPGGTSHSLGAGVIQLETPSEVPGISFERTGRTLLHELGHQGQVVLSGGWGQFMSTWRWQKEQYTLPGAYETKGTLEYDADQFANRYLPRLYR
jgi:hypothetical protein